MPVFMLRRWTVRLRKVGSNMTELHKDGNVILFSYETPVASNVDGGFIRTQLSHSLTTTRHIHKWLRGASYKTVPQQTIEDVLNG